MEEKKGGFSAEDKELIKAMMKKEEMEVRRTEITKYSKYVIFRQRRRTRRNWRV